MVKGSSIATLSLKKTLSSLVYNRGQICPLLCFQGQYTGWKCTIVLFTFNLLPHIVFSLFIKWNFLVVDESLQFLPCIAAVVYLKFRLKLSLIFHFFLLWVWKHDFFGKYFNPVISRIFLPLLFHCFSVFWIFIFKINKYVEF